MKTSRKNSDLVYRRLDEVSMSEYERMQARAHLERAEAIADFILAGGRAIARLFRRLVVRPLRRVAASVG